MSIMLLTQIQLLIYLLTMFYFFRVVILDSIEL